MAYLFGLAIECGPLKESAQAVSDHFLGYEFSLSNHQLATFSVETHDEVLPTGESVYWAHVFNNEFQAGAATKEIAGSITEVGWSLYEKLKSAPTYRFAIAGIETLEAISWNDLNEILNDQEGLNDYHHGLVINESLLPTSNLRNLLEPFSPGYLWKPYEGEKHM